jgi:hypothetical protein
MPHDRKSVSDRQHHIMTVRVHMIVSDLSVALDSDIVIATQLNREDTTIPFPFSRDFNFLRRRKQLQMAINKLSSRMGAAAVVLGASLVAYTTVSYVMEPEEQNFVGKCVRFCWTKFRVTASFVQGWIEEGYLWPRQDDIHSDVRAVRRGFRVLQQRLKVASTRKIVESAQIEELPISLAWARRQRHVREQPGQ